MEEKQIKRICIDTNSIHPANGEPFISIEEAEFFGLFEGEEIKAYQDNDEWVGIVKYPPPFWYVSLGDGITLPDEMAEALDDGFDNGMFFGVSYMKDQLYDAMVKKGIPTDIIKELAPIRRLKR